MLQYFLLITWWLTSDAQMVVLLKTHMINSLVGRNGSEWGPRAHSRKAPAMEHEGGNAVVKTGQMGTEDGGMCGEQAGLRDATCWNLEACCVASVPEPGMSVCCWQASPPAEVPESLLKPQGCDLPGSSPQQPLQSVQCRVCVREEVEEPPRSVCEAPAREGGLIPTFGTCWRKKTILLILEVEFNSYTR